jgi:hypothetical protein
MLKLRAGCQEILLSGRTDRDRLFNILPGMQPTSSRNIRTVLNSLLADALALSSLRQFLSDNQPHLSVNLLTDHQVLDELANLADRGVISLQAGTPPDGCCCCVESIDLTDFWWQNWTSGAQPMAGHFFRPVIKLKYGGAGAHRSCTLEWWEKTNQPYTLVPQPNSWTRITDKKAGSIEKWAQQVKEPCPGSETITLMDPPSLAEGGDRSLTRVLEFRIVVNSGSGCSSCGNARLQATARQTLVMEKGKVIKAKSKFEVPNPADP